MRNLYPITRIAHRTLTAITLIALSASARAYDLAHILRSAPEVRLRSDKPIDAIEGCIVLSDLPAPPIVYRYTNKPGELIHGGREAVPTFVFELIPAGDHLDVLIWKGAGQRDKLERCINGAS